MVNEEIAQRYLLFGFHFETVVAELLARGLALEDMIPAARKVFYDSLNEEKVKQLERQFSYQSSIREYFRFIDESSDCISLTEIAKQYSDNQPGYVIQSWMRSKNTVEFLRQWELENNPSFDDSACKALVERAQTSPFTLTPSQWVKTTKAVGMRVKQGKGGGIMAHPDIASDFHMWLDPRLRLVLVKFMRENLHRNKTGDGR